MLHLSQAAEDPTGKRFAAAQHVPHAILCAGAKSSASTWLFNVVAEILRHRADADAASYERIESAGRREGENVKQFYADSPNGFPNYDEHADTLVIQTQRPSSSLCALALEAGFPVVMTIREPRDAIASLMKRFGYSFSSAFKAVATGNAPMVQLFRHASPLVLRFEDRFYDREVTIAAVARFLGVELPPPLLSEVFGGLTRDAVSRKIEEMRQSGAFGTSSNPVLHDVQTRWQLHHVGDIAIGEHARLLTREQQLLVLGATQEYCSTFGYPLEPDQA